MSIIPAPSASGRGEIVLQPNYFTSSIFVTAMRDDIATLVLLFHEQYTRESTLPPFELFKNVWRSEGWKWFHFMVFDSRSRNTFLDVACRLFLEKMARTEAPFTRVVALFALYTFLYTQPKDTAPPLFGISHVPISIDNFLSVKALPGTLISPNLVALQPSTMHILSVLLKDQVFLILPPSGVGPMNPRELPREIFIDEMTTIRAEYGALKKKGRPTKSDKVKKAKAALNALDDWVKESAEVVPEKAIGSSGISHGVGSGDAALATTIKDYSEQKARLLKEMMVEEESGMEVIEKVNETILARLKEARKVLPLDDLPGTESKLVGVERIEEAVLTRGGVLLLLVERNDPE